MANSYLHQEYVKHRMQNTNSIGGAKVFDIRTEMEYINEYLLQR